MTRCDCDRAEWDRQFVGISSFNHAFVTKCIVVKHDKFSFANMSYTSKVKWEQGRA